MKKVLSVCMVALTAITMLTGCGKTEQEQPTTGTSGKVVVNIEGTVSSIDGKELTLDTGMVVVISEDTVFAGDPDTNNQVSDAFDVGNFVQGYTSDDLSLEKVTAKKIYTNEAP